MPRWTLVVTVIVAVLVSACSGNETKAGPTTSVATAAPAPVSRWDKSTVFDYGFGASDANWQQGCGQVPIGVREGDPCVLQVMKLGNASASTVEFYQEHHAFLATFEEHGRVDYGRSGAPWFNMGRPTPLLFLNGSPDVIDAPLPMDYKNDPGYASVLVPPTAEPRNTFTPLPDFPWGEFGQVDSATGDASGQRFVISYPLQGCRACRIDGYMPVVYSFDTQGKLTKTETLPFKPK